MRYRTSLSQTFRGVLRTMCAALLLNVIAASAQNASPQPNFADQVRAAGPSVYLNFNDVSSNFKDRVSGSVFGGLAPSVIPPSSANTSVGYFNGSNDYVATASTTALSPAAITVAGWVYISSFPGAYNTVLQTAGGAYGTIQLMVKSNGTLAVYTTSGTTGVDDYDGTGTHTLATGTWYFLAAAYDSVNGLKGYVNGALDGSAAANGTLSATAGSFAIGYDPAFTRYWSGRISDVSLYDVALTQAQIQGLQTGSTYAGLLGHWQLNEGGGSTAIDTSGNSNNGTWNGTGGSNAGYYLTSLSGTVAVRQPGFDTTEPDNTSAAFSYNAFSMAPDNTLGSIDWNVPYSMLVHVDRLQWNRTGSLVLASKGDLAAGPGWQLVLRMNGTISQLCFLEDGAGQQQGACTNAGVDAMPNGYNYDLVVTNSGTGGNGQGNTNAVQLYINGLAVASPAVVAPYGSGFGYVQLSVSGGTGYANSTNVTATGGGPNCVVTQVMSASSGVPSGFGASAQASNFGCTSVPTISLVSPTGTGAVITGSLTATTMNDTSHPLMIPGYVSGGAYNGIAGGTSNQTSTYVDEAAIFPGVLTQAQITQLYDQTKFYQELMAKPAVPPLVIISEDGCGDTDNLFAIAMLIRAHQLGYVKLIGLENTQGDGVSEAVLRQMLDQAGLNNVPEWVTPTFNSLSNTCTAANASAFNASTPQVTSAYPGSVTMYRTLFAKYPTTPIAIMSGAGFTGIAALMTSPADSISSLTGAQLWARNATNGGAVYVQGLSENLGFGAYYDYPASQTVFDNDGGMPFYWYGGTPQIGGPGILEARTSKDPFWMTFHSLGNETRTCWDCLAVAGIVTPQFSGGVNISIGGSGTGYAQYTPFTSVGGGPNCIVTGTLVSSGGVPSGILTAEGEAANAQGVGYGCTNAASPPAIVLTNPAGTGVTLTASTTASGCGTITQSTASNGVTSQTACTQQYFLPFTIGAEENGSAPVFQWYINSLVDPIPVGSPRRQ